MKLKHLNKARDQALKSLCEQRIGSVITLKDKIISMGYNKQKTHPKAPSPFHHIHGEVDAIFKAPKELLKGSTIYVYRITPGNNKGLSRPCKYCLNFIKKCGIVKVYYSTENHWEGIEL
jgi:deoxycytidylate deaminase